MVTVDYKVRIAGCTWTHSVEIDDDDWEFLFNSDPDSPGLEEFCRDDWLDCGYPDVEVAKVDLSDYVPEDEEDEEDEDD